MWDLDVRPDGREVAIAAGSEGLLRFELSPEPGGPAVLKPALSAEVLPPGEAVRSAAYSVDGRRLAFASNGSVTVVDTSSGGQLGKTRPLDGDIVRVALSGAGAGRIGASSFDYALRSWPMDGGADPDLFVGHRKDVPDFAFMDDRDYLVSVSYDGSIRLWDTRTRERDTRTQDEVSNRRMARYNSARKLIRYQFTRVAAVRSSPLAPPDDPRRNRIATLGTEAQPEPGDAPAETLTLWNIAPREEAERLKALTSERPEEDPGRARNLLQLARERQRDPRILGNQIPSCP
jgi:WD40 repeat protein